MILHYPFGNHIGEQFGHLLAVGAIETDADTGDPVIYDCKCMKCGREHIHVLDRDLLTYKVRCCDQCDRYDLTGMKFGRWTVLKKSSVRKLNHICWDCKCECGTIRAVLGNLLVTRNSLSCGCLHREIIGKILFKDLTGKSFGRLTVIKRVENGRPMKSNPRGVVRYECKCECGNTCIVSSGNLMSGLVKSCGCLHRENARMLKFKDLTGMKFGKLTVIGLSNDTPPNKKGVVWKCKCDCGNTVDVRSYLLLSGATKSCGCLHKEVLKLMMTKWTPEEAIISRRFNGMKQRCYNKNNRRYPQYGGRGIYICEEWLNDKRKFIDWAKNNGFRPDLTIDRIDVNGPYSPDNCRWVSNLEQANNKQNSYLINADHVKNLIGALANESGVSYDSLLKKLISKHEFFTDHDIKALSK